MAIALIFIIILVGVIILLQGQAKQKKHAKAERAHEREERNIIYSGKYLRGHPDINTPIAVTNTQVSDSEITIYAVHQAEEYSIVGKIPISAISNVLVEDASKRITATRLLALGVFAFAAKKTELHSEFYMTITWGKEKIPNETIFEFDGLNAQTNASKLRNIIAKCVNATAAA